MNQITFSADGGSFGALPPTQGDEIFFTEGCVWLDFVVKSRALAAGHLTDDRSLCYRIERLG